MNYRSGAGAVHAYWVPELPAVMPECPSGFMWLARPCCEIDAGCVSSFAEQTYVEVCDPVLADVAESLPVLECGVFVEPLPDQIAPVYEYGEVQAFSWKDVVAGEAREFSLDPSDFPDLSVNGDAQRQQDPCGGEQSDEDAVDSLFGRSTPVSPASESKEFVRSKVHPNWAGLAVRIPVEFRCQVVLEPWETAGDWGACVCCTSYMGRVVWVDRDDHFSSKRHLKAMRNGHATAMANLSRGDTFGEHERNVSLRSPFRRW